MYLKCLLLTTIFIYLIKSTNTQDYELSDFDFESDTNQTNLEDNFENDLSDFEDEEVDAKPKLSREALVREIILNSMKSPDMKEKVARVLPILRVMTPEQKLALASLVTSQVLTPDSSSGLTLDQVSALFGNNPNTTAELMLPISLDVANMFRTSRSEKDPKAEELRMPYKRPPGIFRRNIIDRSHNKYLRTRKPINKGSSRDKELPNCELFSSSICLKSHDYPIEQIMSSIRRNKHAMNALLTDYRALPTEKSEENISTESEKNYDSDYDESNEIRRTGTETGYMCPSIIRQARPQKARATSGHWKYIVNTADHTQTLRLERCKKAGDSCTYLNDNFKSRCLQVYNYHRLLTWDRENGLHMDIFKVPTCCSCHIDNYKVPFPPHYANHQTTSEHFPGEELENDVAQPAISHTDDQNLIYESSHIQDTIQEYPDITYQQESTKLRPSTTEPRPSLPKYLEAPKPQRKAPTSFITSNHNYKRSNTPKPFSSSKRPNRPLRRRPIKPVRDLAHAESNYGQVTTDIPTTQPPKEFTRKINYNYHPIIDFFKPDKIESRMDTGFEGSDWRPVTSMLLATERTSYRKR